MRSLLRTLVLAVPVLAALACGGRVDGVGDGGGACPAAASIQSGGSCNGNGQTCPWISDGCGGPLSCTCSGGSWACEESNGTPCAVCPVQVTAGSACTAAQQGCTSSATVYDCGVATTISCDCEQGAWTCEGTLQGCPDAQVCPSPSSVQEGVACDVYGMQCSTGDPIVDCNGNVTGYYACECSGGSWQCPFPPAPNCDAGGPCPQPIDVVMDTACGTDGQHCPGNPQQCGGQVLYDAFECQQGLWEDVAVTYCDLDGGQ